MKQIPLELDAHTGVALQRARVWMWCAHLMNAERDAGLYAYPRTITDDEVEMLGCAGDRFYAKAGEVLGREIGADDWREALSAFSG